MTEVTTEIGFDPAESWDKYWGEEPRTLPPHPLAEVEVSPLPEPRVLVPRLLTLPEVEHYLGVSERTMYRIFQTGRLKAVRAGACLRVRVDDLAEYVELRGPRPGAPKRGRPRKGAQPSPSPPSQ
jgi:excisionase family DNA binding protein